MPDPKVPACVQCIRDQIKGMGRELATATVALSDAELFDLRRFYIRTNRPPVDVIFGLPIYRDDSAKAGGEVRLAAR